MTAANDYFLTRGIEFDFGPFSATAYGGPYRKFQRTRRLIGVKMAAEIKHDHDISVPTEDFSVPDAAVVVQALKDVFISMSKGNDIYAGCMGGTGRTGLFLGCLSKAYIEFCVCRGEPVPTKDPVAYTRMFYKPSAIETTEQENFVRTLDVSSVVGLLVKLTSPNVVFKERVCQAEHAPQTVLGAFCLLWRRLRGL